MKWLRRASAGLWLAAGAASAAPPAGGAGSPVEVQLEQPFQQAPVRTGLFPVRLALRNRSEEAHGIRVLAEADDHRVERRLSLAARESADLELLVPQLSGRYWDLKVESDREGLLLRQNVHAQSAAGRPPSFLLVSQAPVDLGSILTPGSPYGGYDGLGAWVKPKDLPASWMGLSGIDRIALEAETFAGLPPPQRSAITGYLETGGDLVVLGAEVLSGADLARLLPALRPSRQGELARYGFGRVHLFEEDPSAGADAAAWRRAFAPFGRLHAAQRLGLQERNDYDWGRRSQAAVLPGLEPVPARPFAFAMILFAVVAGPVNFFVLTRLKRRSAALLTIPLLSGAMATALALFALFHEGLDVKAVPRTVTFLDARTHRASSIARHGYYANLAPSGGLRFPPETVPFPISPPGRRDAGLAVDWTGGCLLPRGWVPPRVPVERVFLQAGPCRQRILAGKPDARGLPVTNGLEAGLKALWVRGSDGVLYEARGLPAGQTAFARPADPLRLEALRKRRTPVWEEEIPAELRLPWLREATLDPKEPDPGCFAAVADRSIFAGLGTDDAKLLPGFHIVLGTTEEE